LRLGDYTLSVTFDRAGQVPASQAVVSGGLVIAIGSDEFIFAGTGLTVTFEASSAGEPTTGILSVQEGKYANGRWVPGRWLNGDQTNQGRHLRLDANRFSIQRIKLYRYR
jgi:beta-galactosidase GanA